MKKLLTAFVVLSLGIPALVGYAFVETASNSLEGSSTEEIDWGVIKTALRNLPEYQAAIENIPAHEQPMVTEAVAISTTTPRSLKLNAIADDSIVIGAAEDVPFNKVECGGRNHYGELSHQQGDTFCYGPAPNGYKARINPYLCQNMEQYFRTCPVFSAWGSMSDFGKCGATSGSTWGPPGQLSTTAWGTWTSWWKGLSAYCMDNGYWESSDASKLPDVNTSAQFSFTVAGSAGSVAWKAEELQNDQKMVAARGWNQSGPGSDRRRLMSPTFNSPFIYLKNQVGPVMVKLKSTWDQYTSQVPAFNLDNGWQVKDDRVEPLFYELGLTEVSLSRNGKLFADELALVAFLENSNFFAQLGFSEAEAENSLGYLLPKLPESAYYYLTILSPEAVADLSQMEIEPSPETLVRRYFAVYPTAVPVSVTGNLVFPAVVPNSGFTVRDYGEILITPDMFVAWES